MSSSFDHPKFAIAVAALEQAMRAADGVSPDLYAAVRIENWRLVWAEGGLGLIGKVSGHPHIIDGHTALTSTLVAIDVERRFAITQNTIYRLGCVSDEVGR